MQDYVSEAGTDVNVQIRFFKVESVLPVEGAMRLKVWYRLSWIDDRLSWNASKYGGITSFQANSGDGGQLGADLEIWVPDIQPYNSREGVDKTLDTAQAIVSSSGNVFWRYARIHKPDHKPMP